MGFFLNTAKIITPTKKNQKIIKKIRFSKIIRNPKVDEVTSEENHLTKTDGDLHSGLMLLNRKELVQGLYI